MLAHKRSNPLAANFLLALVNDPHIQRQLCRPSSTNSRAPSPAKPTAPCRPPRRAHTGSHSAPSAQTAASPTRPADRAAAHRSAHSTAPSACPPHAASPRTPADAPRSRITSTCSIPIRFSSAATHSAAFSTSPLCSGVVDTDGIRNSVFSSSRNRAAFSRAYPTAPALIRSPHRWQTEKYTADGYSGNQRSWRRLCHRNQFRRAHDRDPCQKHEQPGPRHACHQRDENPNRIRRRHCRPNQFRPE